MRILIADDHWVSRAGLKQLLVELGADIEFLEAASFDETLRVARESPALDLILLDLVMPGLAGAEGIGALIEAVPDVPVAVLSVIDDRAEVLRAIDLGAMGYISKSSDGRAILSVLRSVLGGEVSIPRALLDRAASPIRGQWGGEGGSGGRGGLEDEAARFDARIRGLTPRQREVLACIAQGKANIKIASELGLSENTVRGHVSAILRALNVTNRTQAAIMAAELLGEPGDDDTG